MTGNTFFVSTSGNDSNLGTELSPWKTIGRALNSDSPVRGEDIIYIKSGTYNEKVNVLISGSQDKYITLSSFPSHSVTIDGSGKVKSEGGVIQIVDRNWIRITGLTIINGWSSVYTDRATNIMIDNNTLAHTDHSTLYISGKNQSVNYNIIIQYNDIYDSLRTYNSQWEMVSLLGLFGGFDISYNYIHDTYDDGLSGGGIGIDVKEGGSYGNIHHNIVTRVKSQGIYIDGRGTVSNINIYNNKIDTGRTGHGISIQSERVGNVSSINIFNNIVTNFGYNGIAIGDYIYPSEKSTIDKVNIFNNVVYSNGASNEWPGIAIGKNYNGGYTIKNVVVSNNIVSKNKYASIVVYPTGSGTIVSHNLIQDYYGRSGETKGINYVEGDPKFINTSIGDFHIQYGSPAIDKGTSIGAPNKDFDDNFRPSGAGYDIGAYEYGSSSGCPDLNIIINIV